MASRDPRNLQWRKTHQLELCGSNLPPKLRVGAHSYWQRECDVQIAMLITEPAKLRAQFVPTTDCKCAADWLGPIAQDIILHKAGVIMFLSDRSHNQNPAHA